MLDSGRPFKRIRSGTVCSSEDFLSERPIGFDRRNRRHSYQVAPLTQLMSEVLIAITSNSTWIDETTPCITYGLRGVVHCSIEV